jgi:hypothetical protein
VAGAWVGLQVVVGSQGLDHTEAKVLIAAGGALVDCCGADGTAELRCAALCVGRPDLQEKKRE